MKTNEASRHQLRWLVAIAGVVALVAVPAGLAFRGGSTGSLSGRVLYHGTPLATGTVIAAVPDGATFSTPIAADGRYAFAKLPSGKLQFAVLSRDPAKAKLQRAKLSKSERLTAEDLAAPASVGKWIAIPPQYERPADSGLETVLKGTQSFDLLLN